MIMFKFDESRIRMDECYDNFMLNSNTNARLSRWFYLDNRR